MSRSRLINPLTCDEQEYSIHCNELFAGVEFKDSHEEIEAEIQCIMAHGMFQARSRGGKKGGKIGGKNGRNFWPGFEDRDNETCLECNESKGEKGYSEYQWERRGSTLVAHGGSCGRRPVLDEAGARQRSGAVCTACKEREKEKKAGALLELPDLDDQEVFRNHANQYLKANTQKQLAGAIRTTANRLNQWLRKHSQTSLTRDSFEEMLYLFPGMCELRDA